MGVHVIARRPSRRRRHRVLGFCFGLPADPAEIDPCQTAWAHSMGRTANEGMSRALPAATGHPFSYILIAGRKVVVSRSLKTAAWPNTTIAAGDTAEEIDELRRGVDDHKVAWGGVRFWRSLMRLDLIDEFHLGVHPYVAGEGNRPFEDVCRDRFSLRPVATDWFGPPVGSSSEPGCR